MTVTETTDTTSVAGKIVKKFTTNLSPGGGQDSITWVCPSGVTNITYLIVAGGGSGGGRISGGGGAGGLLQGTLTVTPGTPYTIKIGAGGSLVTNSFANGNNGSNSEISGSGITTLTAIGGGAGRAYGEVAPSIGGSAGGGSYGRPPGSYTSGQGNAGGTGDNNADRGGGGGGAGGAGGNAVTSIAGAGGIGIQSSITGTALFYAGGGGGCRYGSGDLTGLGGSSIGGHGGYFTYNGGATDGVADTGSGGGGQYGTNASGAGANGIVILQYDALKILVRTITFQVTRW